MLLGISGYLYLNLFQLPTVPILLSGDQTYFWMNGQRMLHGERPYLDFFQFTPPGADVLYFGLFKAFGPRILPLNFTVLVLGVMLSWLCFIIAEQMMERHLALLSALLFLSLVYTRLLNATHHYFSVLAVMGATALLMRETSPRRLAAAGALLGVASWFTQTHGATVLLAFTFFLGWEQYRTHGSWRSFWREERILFLSFTIALLIMNAPFIASVGVKQLWYCQITYVRKVMVHLPETRLLGIPQYANWRTLPLLFVIADYGRHFLVYGMLPTVYLLVLMRCWREQFFPAFCFRKAALLGLVGSFLLGELIFSLNWLRVYAVSMAGIILFIWAISTSTRFRRSGLISVWALVVLLGFLQPWFTQHRKYITAEMPAGRTAIEPEDAEKLSWGIEHTTPGEFLFQASSPSMYIPLGVRNPVFLDTASTMFNSQWVEWTIQQLEAKQVHYIIWAERLDYPVNLRRPITVNILPLRNYLHTRYQLTRRFQDGDEVWERR